MPVGIVEMWLTWRLLPPSPPEHKYPPDLRGMLLSGASLSLFMIGIESAGRGVLSAGVPWMCVVVGLVLFRVTRCFIAARSKNSAIDFFAAQGSPPFMRRLSRAVCSVPARAFRHQDRAAPSGRKSCRSVKQNNSIHPISYNSMIQKGNLRVYNVSSPGSHHLDRCDDLSSCSP